MSMSTTRHATLLHRLTRHLHNHINPHNHIKFPHQSHKLFSTSSEYTTDDLNKARFVRFFAAIFMLTAGIRVAPWVAANTVDHCIKLMDVDSDRLSNNASSFLVKSGISRLSYLSYFESARLRAIEVGAIPRLEQLSQRHSDESVREAARDALHRLLNEEKKERIGDD